MKVLQAIQAMGLGHKFKQHLLRPSPRSVCLNTWDHHGRMRPFRNLQDDFVSFRVESFSHENSELKKKVDSLENNNRSLLGQLQKLQSLVGKIRPSGGVPQTGTALMVGCNFVNKRKNYDTKTSITQIFRVY